MTTWGAYRNNTRLGVDLVADISGSTATVWCDFWFEARVNVIDSSNVLTWSGEESGSKSPGISWSGTGTQEIHYISFTRSLIYGETQDLEISAVLSNVDYAAGNLEATAYLTLPSRPYQLPRPPKTPTVVKNSDTSHTVAWTTDYTDNAGGYPWKSVYIERRINNGAWTQIATVSYSTTSYTDTTTVADRQYTYRVRSSNSTGQSAYATTSSTYTTPAAHTNLAWTKTTSDVVLTWTTASTLAVTTEVQESTNDGTTWTSKATVAAGTNTWTHVAPSTATTHRYRVRPTISGVAGAWTVSTVVTLLAAPLAPTSVQPSGTTLDPVSDTITATWAHNPADGTGQTAYEHQIKETGGSYTTSGTVTSTTSSRTLTGLVRGKTYLHQVRTKGQHSTWSPWSSEEAFTTGAIPQAGITVPGLTYGTSRLTATWTYYDLESTAQTAAQVELTQGGATIAAATLGAVTSYTVPFDLANNTTYTFRVRVRDSSGLWSAWATTVFTTAFIPPPAATTVATFDPATGATTLAITNPPADGTTTVDPISNTVHRLTAGTWQLVAAGVPINSTISDPVPAIGPNTYRVTTWSATPSSATATIDVTAASPWLYLNGGPGNAIMARVRGGASIALTAARPKTLHQFVGLAHPVEFAGTARARAYAVSGSVDAFSDEGWGDWASWEAVAELPAPLVYRDPLGRYELVSIGDVKIDHDTGSKKAKVSATLTVVTP